MRPNALHFINKWFWIGVDWIFPPRCVGCNKSGYRLCTTCLEKIQRISHPYCVLCGKKLIKGSICSTCKVMPLKITAIRSWAVYDATTRKALHQLKYYRNISLGETFSQFLCNLLIETGWEIDVVTPIPLGYARRKQRGYNQAALLAKPVAQKLNIRYQPKIVTRNRETISQVNLNYAERKNNVLGAFDANENLAYGKNVLIIDDVTTSGSTLDACADALFKAGAKNVYGMTVARAG